MSDITVKPLDLQFPATLPAPVELIPIVRGMQGPEGPPGPPGEPGNAVDLPDLTITFENGLV